MVQAACQRMRSLQLALVLLAGESLSHPHGSHVPVADRES